MAHMLNIQGLEEEENLLHPFFPLPLIGWKRRIELSAQISCFPGKDAGSCFVPAWLEPFQSVPAVEVTQGMAFQNRDALLLRQEEELVPERCIGVKLDISVSCALIREAKQRDCGHCCVVRVIKINGIIVFVIWRLLVTGVKTKAGIHWQGLLWL